jgi:1-acyl-sn-glycerol-3-phosphate acyltransferase
MHPARDIGLPFADRMRCLLRESGPFEMSGRLGCWALLQVYLAAYHRFTVIGCEHLPVQPPFVLVSNHTSDLDALCLVASLRWRLQDRVFTIAAGETFFSVPVKTVFAALLFQRPAERVAATDYIRARFTHHRAAHDYPRLRGHVSIVDIDVIILDISEGWWGRGQTNPDRQ